MSSQHQPTASERELTGKLFAVLAVVRQHAASRAGEFDLSFVQARALVTLDEPQPMRTFAERLGLDPSNLTTIVDRLEARGLLTREPMPTDRRVKLLSLTVDGQALRRDLVAVFAENPAFAGLTEQEQSTLGALLGKALDQAGDAAPTPVG